MKLYKWVRTLALLSLPLTLAACATTGEHNALQAQVNQMSRQMSSSQTNQADNWSQLMEMRQEIADMRGQMDAINRALERSGGAQKLADTVASHSRALRLVESQMALDLQLDADPSAQPSAGADTLPGSAPVTEAPAGMAAPAAVPAVAPTPSHAAPQAASPAASSGDVAQALYDSGMNAFNQRKYQSSLKSFSDFTKTYPKHKLASNAWFWQGENNYQLKKYAEAALAYQKVIEGYPNSAKAPASYLKQGMTFLQLGKKDAAKQRLNELVRKFPKAPETTRAKQVIKQNKL